MIKMRSANDKLVGQLSDSLRLAHKTQSANKYEKLDQKLQDSASYVNHMRRSNIQSPIGPLANRNARIARLRNSSLDRAPVQSMTQDLNLLERLLSKSNAFLLPSADTVDKSADNNNNNNNKLDHELHTTTEASLDGLNNSRRWLLLQTVDEDYDKKGDEKWSRNENPSSKIKRQQQHKRAHKWIHSRLATHQTKQDEESATTTFKSDKKLSIIQLNGHNFTNSRLANLKTDRLATANNQAENERLQSDGQLSRLQSKPSDDFSLHCDDRADDSQNEESNGTDNSDSDESNDYEDSNDDDDDDDDDLMELPSCDWLHSKDDFDVSARPYPAGQENVANGAKFYENCHELPECEWAGQCTFEWIYSSQQESQNKFYYDNLKVADRGKLGGWSRISRARCKCPIGRAGLLCQKRKYQVNEKFICSHP